MVNIMVVNAAWNNNVNKAVPFCSTTVQTDFSSSTVQILVPYLVRSTLYDLLPVGRSIGLQSYSTMRQFRPSAIG